MNNNNHNNTIYDYKVLEVRLENVEHDLSDIKADVKEHKGMYNETIIMLRENLVRITTLMENQETQLKKQDQTLERQDKTLNEISNEVSYLRHSVEKQKKDSGSTVKIESPNEKWYQKMLENYWRVFAYIFIILLAFSLGIKMSEFNLSDVIKLFGG